jgi:hypothetical protein
LAGRWAVVKAVLKAFYSNCFIRNDDVQSWTTLEEDYIGFLLPAQKCINCIKQVLMLKLSKIDTYTGFSTGPQVRM